MTNLYMTTYTTPLDRARALLDDLVEFAMTNSYRLPADRYVQIGDIVRDCEAVIVSAGNLTPDPFYDPVDCVSPRTSTFLIEILRGCAVVTNQKGLTIRSALEHVSEQGSKDGQFLFEFAQQIDGWSSKQPWTVVWSLAEAGLQVASLQITIGIP